MMLNTMLLFIMLLIACTTRIARADRYTYKTTTATLAVHARRGLITAALHHAPACLTHPLLLVTGTIIMTFSSSVMYHGRK